MRIPYSHSGVLASALAMHKERTKDVYRAAGIPGGQFHRGRSARGGARHLMEPPYVVKPVNEGSSVGVFIIRKGDNRPPAALGSEEWNLSSEMMVEEFVPGRELTVAVMGNRRSASPRSPPISISTTTKRNMLPADRSTLCRRRSRHP
jgi:D-alanine-D-alanine ligase